MASLPHRRWQANKKKLRSAEVQFQNRMTTPDHSLAMAMPTNVREMDNQTLITLAALNDHAACSEMLIRHIMTADRFSYDMALEKYQEIDTFHKQGMMMYLFPFQIGIVTSLTAAVASGPLCFHLPSVHLFNHHFVTTSVPEPEDLETWLEVGSWAWNWMEPPLGQISFFLLCLQFSRAQLSNLGIRPYTRYVKQVRINRLVKQFPHYDERIMASYSKTAKLWS
ncbi:hypothetical protein MHU86_15489 [Fragilaria crotonensis]|nr:hypothetical protein MHU86_15489 [Fragilaria crotonensis]